MKRLFAALMILAMLMSMGITTAAEPAEIEKKPFTLVNWTVGTKEYTNVYYMPFFWSSGAKYRESLRNGEVMVCWREVGNVDTIPELAVKLKELFDTFPKGSRYINFSTLVATFQECNDICFFERIPPMISKWLDEFFTEYKRIGGQLDGMAVDIEYLDIYCHYIEGNYFKNDPQIYSKLEQNPAYQEKIRPRLVERGFKFYENITEYTPELYALCPKSGSQYTLSRNIWDTVMRNYLNDIINESMAPLFKHFPDATLSDYTVKQMQPWIKEVSEGGGVIGSGGNKTTVGNANNENFYSVRPNSTFFKDGNAVAYKTLPGYVGVNYENTKFNRFMFEANLGKTTYLGKGDNRITWWMAHAYYGEKNAHTPYYSELLFHLGLLNPEVYLGYILQQDCITDGKRDPEKYQHALQIVDDCLRQMSDIAGYTDRKAIAVEPSWNHSFVLSGMYAKGRNVWRITPDTDKISVADFKISDTDPTFKVGNETVTFPGGRIIPDSAVYDIGTCGYWVETAADVMPAITRTPEYHRFNSGYQETYENYAIGAKYSFDTARPKDCWQIKTQAGGTATIIADPTNGSNKVLAVTGSFAGKNVNMPGNIHAGDSYAKHQAWEVTFTLPADMPTDAELQLLNVIPEKETATDQGVKIAGGKLYYDQAGSFAELAGVTLNPGGKYTLIREMDFSLENAYTSSYYLYGAEGKLLGKAENIPTARMESPVYSINLSAKNITGEAVLFDDYRLYPTQVTTDFFLYDAALGLKLEDLNKPHTGSVGYRLSWLNATDTDKSYSVVAAYYDGEAKASEEVIAEVILAAGKDGILTGVAEHTQTGKTMLVYLRENTISAENLVPEAQPVNKTHLIVIIASVATVAVVGVVTAVIMVKKTKKTKAE